jgi:hypothetical protein
MNHSLVFDMIHSQSNPSHKPILIPDLQFTFLFQVYIFQMVFLLILSKYSATKLLTQVKAIAFLVWSILEVS